MAKETSWVFAPVKQQNMCCDGFTKGTAIHLEFREFLYGYCRNNNELCSFDKLSTLVIFRELKQE